MLTGSSLAYDDVEPVHAVVKDGSVVRRDVIRGRRGRTDPSGTQFHSPGEALFAIVFVTGAEGGKA